MISFILLPGYSHTQALSLDLLTIFKTSIWTDYLLVSYAGLKLFYFRKENAAATVLITMFLTHIGYHTK